MTAAARKTLCEEQVLQTLSQSTYQETADHYGVSRGKVYTIAHHSTMKPARGRVIE